MDAISVLKGGVFLFMFFIGLAGLYAGCTAATKSKQYIAGAVIVMYVVLATYFTFVALSG